MSNPLLLIRIKSSPTENCLNIVFTEAEYDRKLFFQLIRCCVCRDTLVRLIWDELSQMFGIFRFHPWSEWWTDGFSASFFLFCEGWGRAPPAVISPRLFLNHTENNHPLGHWVNQQGGNQTTDLRKLLLLQLCGYSSGQHRGGKSHCISRQG